LPHSLAQGRAREGIAYEDDAQDDEPACGGPGKVLRVVDLLGSARAEHPVESFGVCVHLPGPCAAHEQDAVEQASGRKGDAENL
jgi:hypothetical protein